MTDARTDDYVLYFYQEYLLRFAFAFVKLYFGGMVKHAIVLLLRDYGRGEH